MMSQRARLYTHVFHAFWSNKLELGEKVFNIRLKLTKTNMKVKIWMHRFWAGWGMQFYIYIYIVSCCFFPSLNIVFHGMWEPLRLLLLCETPFCLLGLWFYRNAFGYRGQWLYFYRAHPSGRVECCSFCTIKLQCPTCRLNVIIHQTFDVYAVFTCLAWPLLFMSPTFRLLNNALNDMFWSLIPDLAGHGTRKTLFFLVFFSRHEQNRLDMVTRVKRRFWPLFFRGINPMRKRCTGDETGRLEGTAERVPYHDLARNTLVFRLATCGFSCLIWFLGPI